MKRILSLGLLAVLALCFAALAQAEDKSSGCGLGWRFNGKTSWFGVTTRGTTHSIAPPTFGMTSGTSGCAYHSIVKVEEVPAVDYAIANYDKLQIEMAQGSGDTLSGLALMMGCSSGSLDSFSRSSQESFLDVGNQSNGAELYMNLRQKVRSSPELSKACPNVG